MIFVYGEKEISHLTRNDPVLWRAIESIGPIRREVIPDLFEALVSFILGQQISVKAYQTIRGRMQSQLGSITPDTISLLSVEDIQALGTTFRKAAYVKNAAEKVQSGDLDLISLKSKSDEEVCAALSALSGVGVWTAQMLMLLSMQRPDIISFGDLAIRRGLCVLYGQKSIDREQFESYRQRYSPYASVASLYLWAIAAGAMNDWKADITTGGEQEYDK